MKKVLSLIAGMVFVLYFRVAYAEEMRPDDSYTSDTMITNEDILKYDHDMGTFNRIPALPDEIQGAAAGGRNKEAESTENSETKEKAAPVEKDKTEPSENRDDTGGPSNGVEPNRY